MEAASLLVGDIGGTNVRFAVATADEERPRLDAVMSLRCADFAGLAEAVTAYLDRAGIARPQRALLAVAAPVTADRVRITNNPWTFSVTATASALGLSLRVVNDFAVVSRALPLLRREDLVPIGQAPVPAAGARQAYAVLGPGTGMGVSGLIAEGGRMTVIESEGGHMDFAPVDATEAEMLRLVAERHGRASVERLVSGMGIANVYHALCEIAGRASQADTAEQVAALAEREPEGLAAQALDRVCAMLGSFAGDIALAFGAWQGVFLHGGVAQKLLPRLQRGVFRQRFETKGRHAPLMRAVPTQLIMHPQAGLLGAAAMGFDAGLFP
jgi:glucokinase